MRLIDLPIFAVRATGFTFLLLSLVAALGVMYALGKPGTRAYKAVFGALVPLGYWPGYIVEIYSILNNASQISALSDYLVPTPSWAFRTLNLPAWVFVGYALLLAAAEVLLAVGLIRKVHRSLSARSVCEGLDQLPDGICFSLPDGFPRLVNNRMQQISNVVFGKSVTDAEQLNKRLETGDLQPGCSVDEDENVTFLVLPDKTALRLMRQTIIVDGKAMTETIAFDVTTRYHALCELRERNARVEKANRELRNSMLKMNSMIREREILNARIHLHDDMGNALLAIRNYLAHPGGDRSALIDLLRMETVLLQKKEISDRDGDPLYAVEEAARMIGAAIHYEGTLPNEYRDIVTVAIHECLTNAVKHAKGKNLFVCVSNEGAQTVIALTNDGEPPAAPIVETGGLADLRKLAGSRGVAMTVESAPKFCLKLKFEN